jgi:hypothetical protein
MMALSVGVGNEKSVVESEPGTRVGGGGMMTIPVGAVRGGMWEGLTRVVVD